MAKPNSFIPELEKPIVSWIRLVIFSTIVKLCST